MHADVHADLAKLSFLIGRWEGVGVAGYADEEEFQFGQELVFEHRPGLPYLNYRGAAWRMRPDGTLGDLVTEESGYWRALSEEDTADREEGAPIVHLEVLITHNEGFIESYAGTVFANRVEMATDAVLHTSTGLDVKASHRLYGLFGDNRETLGYAWDLAARGHSLRSYMSAQLKRAGKDAGER
ncbi:FABP family protein [Nocardiopsis lambiniae]|uniref:Ferric nitrobindin-like protein n=1 Tax=Nocardiopsis lambiniae TaxID=3075539 RepID=A0ABU2M6G9_9ACTN|nr:FABP family protein [Nocardiopsis sp. DSM 44743]MDT0328263.1 FABP family protein [Nocardiopsis sp. DSM 44743]